MKALTFREAGPRLFAAGFQPIPVNGKRPVVKDWEAMTLHEDQIGFWANGNKGALNVGIRTDDLVAVDIDIYRAAVADEVEAAFRARFGDAPKRVGEAPKRLLLYAAKTPGTTITSPWYKTADGLEHRVEVLGIGQQFVAHGTHPDTLRPYTWPEGDILDVERWQLPVVDRDEVAEWVRTDLMRILVVRGFMPDTVGTPSPSGTAGAPLADPDDAFDAVKPRHDDVSLEDLRWMLDQLPANYCDDRDSWRDAIFAVHHQFHDTEEEDDALEALVAWSQRSDKYTEGCVEPIWRKASEQRVGARGPATIGTLKAWLGDVWKARRAKVVAVEVAAVSLDLRQRIAQADEVLLRGELAAEIRQSDLDSVAREAAAHWYAERFRQINGSKPKIADMRHMLQPPPAPAPESAGDGGEVVDIDSPWFLGPDWAREWFWVSSEDKFFHRKTKQLCSLLSFNSRYKWDRANLLVEEGDDTVLYTPYERMVSHWRVRVLDRVAYHPRLPETFELGGLQHANSYREDLRVKPDAAYTDAGRRLCAALERHLSLLIPDLRERALLKAWLAHNYLHPGVKIRWAPLIKGAEGDGKSIFGDILQMLLGLPNVRMMSADTIQSSPFTGWSAGQCVVVLEEVKFHGHNRYDVVNKLKPYITNNAVELHKKGQDPFNALNVSNYLALTNHEDALPIGDGDRRYFVLWSPFATKEVMEGVLQAIYDMGRKQHFDEIFELGRAHPGQMARWLADAEIPEEFQADGDAPITSARDKMVSSALTDVEYMVGVILRTGAPGVGPNVVATAYLEAAMQDQGLEGDIRTRAFRPLLSKAGYTPAHRTSSYTWQGKRLRIWVRSGLPTKPTQEWVREELDKTLEGAFDD